MKTKKITFFGTLILLSVGLILSVSSGAYSNDEKTSVGTKTALKLGKNLPSVTAVLQPEHLATISSEIKGTVATLPFLSGQSFNEGDVLVAFDCRIEKARFARAKAKHDAAKANYKAHKKLNELRSVSSVESQMAKAERDQASADLEEMRVKVDACSIKAPFDGAVVENLVQPYERVDEGKEVLRIISSSNLEVKMLVPSDWLIWLEEQTAIVLEVAETNNQYDAHVKRINAEIDPVSRLVEVTASLNETHDVLKPGMTGAAYFVKGTKVKPSPMKQMPSPLNVPPLDDLNKSKEGKLKRKALPMISETETGGQVPLSQFLKKKRIQMPVEKLKVRQPIKKNVDQGTVGKQASLDLKDYKAFE